MPGMTGMQSCYSRDGMTYYFRCLMAYDAPDAYVILINSDVRRRANLMGFSDICISSPLSLGEAGCYEVHAICRRTALDKVKIMLRRNVASKASACARGMRLLRDRIRMLYLVTRYPYSRIARAYYSEKRMCEHSHSRC